MPIDWALEVTDQLLDALATVHAAGLIHRDVKPANILLEPTADGYPDVRLGDFGIATPRDEPRLTVMHGVIGTPGYVSPEATAGDDPDPRQDLYAVGAVLVEMLTGQKPSRTEPVTVPPGLPWEVAAFIGSLVAPLGQRLPSAGAARQALAGIITPAMPPGAVEVVDTTPPLPEGWGPHGPLQPTTRGRQTRTQEVDPTHAVMPGGVPAPSPYSPTPGTPPPWSTPPGTPTSSALPAPVPIAGWQPAWAPQSPSPATMGRQRPVQATVVKRPTRRPLLMGISLGVAAIGLLLIAIALAL